MSNQEEKEPTLAEQLAKIPSQEIVRMLDQANYWAPEIKAANFRQWVFNRMSNKPMVKL